MNKKRTLVKMIPGQFEHGGNLKKILSGLNSPDEYIDFSANINPLGIPDKTKYFLQKNLDLIDKYPDPESEEFKKTAGEFFGVETKNILPSNGASELFFLFIRLLEQKKVLLAVPSYSDYERAALAEKKEITFITLKEEFEFSVNLEEVEKNISGDEIVILGRPNNPTGKNIARDKLMEIIPKHPNTFFIIDEAFGDFIEFNDNDGSLGSYIYPNLLTIISLTKMYSIPGLRAGFAIGSENIISRGRSFQSSWPVNYLAQKAAVFALNDPDHLVKTKAVIKSGRDFLFEEISRIPALKVFKSEVNFLLFKTIRAEDADRLYDFLLKKRIIVRRCGNFRGLDNSYFRIAVLSKKSNEKLAGLLREFFFDEPARKTLKKPALMILGTGSNVGKSLLCTALCRIFLNEGFRVMPFKAQNMSLNSCVTRNGDEISRAQHLQALAAKAEPDVKMNPVLLKPVEKSLSQIVLMGKPTGNLGFRDYRKNREKIWQVVCQSYDDLSQDADLMILEGAGSPVEMNLKDNDIVNMKMAEYADAKVILAGNIDYGGIFAAFAGTLMLLDNEEKKRVIGLLVNQFRGDESLFTEGKNLLEEITGKKILGTIPFVDKHMLPDEDSLSFGARSGENNKSRGKSKNEAIKVFVLKYPHISNFTDFDPFYMESEIEIKFLDEPDNTLPDIFILPGSKNVAGDLEWMEKQGFTRYIMKLRTEGKTEIVGLCGGLQMLGSMINDPHGIENANLDKPGLGLMGISTEMGIDKVLQKFSGRHIQSNIEISGYEIHHGRTNLHETKNEQSPMDVFKNNPEAGFSTPDGMVWGTYVHGIFDNDDFRLWFINKSRARKGMAPLEEIEKYNLEDAIENFAQIVKERIDLTGIKNALGLS